ncbi:hypothetical protein KC207_13735 [Phycicoccus sp. BSK3Z-2]|uniref:Uncharacterized protein n=1 Tax=Phycicoccus avicenniae TaxID=2828860 RepID=A0A941I0X0_9MICO|nr:hypothetical protein [Phycicoccus avicenniae]MBR7744350.1 hypothetical protein [Phycicoccus avicenniae]
MNLTLSPTPSSRFAWESVPDTDPSSGVLTASVTMTRNSWGISQDLLRGLGARHDIAGAGQNHAEDVRLLTCWLRAYDIRLVVVRNAHLTSWPHLLTFLLDLGQSAHCDIALTQDEDVTGALPDWVEDHGGTIDPALPPLLDRIDSVSRPQHPIPASDVSPFPAFLPDVDFYAFRGMCRDLLPHEEFTVVDDLYVRTFHAVNAEQVSTPEDVSDFLRARISSVTSEGAAVTIARATQAALFKAGIHLYVWMPTLRTAMRRDLHRQLTPAEIRSLRAYRTPWRSAAVALCDAGLTTNDIATLRLHDVDPTGNVAGLGSPLSDDARVFMRAQRFARQTQTAADDDLFITAGAAPLRAELRHAGRELLIPVVTAQAKFNDSRKDTWRKTIGVRLSPLT